MFNIGPAELLIIGLVLLIAVGPEQLPGVIRRVGSTVAQARSMTDGLRSEFMAGLDEIERAADVERWSDSDPAPTRRSTASKNGPSAPKNERDGDGDDPGDRFGFSDDDEADEDHDAVATGSSGVETADGAERDRAGGDDRTAPRPVIADRLFTDAPTGPGDADDEADHGEPVNGTAASAGELDDAEPGDAEPAGDAELAGDAEEGAR